MKQTTETRLVVGAVDDVFDYVADFQTAAEWDPGVESSRRVDEGPVGVGSRFDVGVRFAGRPLPMDYTVAAYERPHRLELTATSPSSTARDVITFEAVGDGATRVTWNLQVSLTGASRLAEPLMGPMLRRLGRVALDGLEATLAQRGATPRS